jgi:hypothetical protein
MVSGNVPLSPPASGQTENATPDQEAEVQSFTLFLKQARFASNTKALYMSRA